MIVGVSYVAVASSLINLVGDFLYNDRMERDQAQVKRISAECAAFCDAADMDGLNDCLRRQAADNSARLMILDYGGKTVFASSTELLGKRMALREPAIILQSDSDIAYGLHGDGHDGPRTVSLLHPLDPSADWYGCCAVRLECESDFEGVLVYTTSASDIVGSLNDLQSKITKYFVIAAIAGFMFAMIFSSILTRPIASIIRSIQRMSHGDLSVRVPEKGTGELRRLSEAFNTMSEKLETLDQSRNQFVSNASHELKTPLATMKILMENIIYQPEMDADMRTEFLTDINKEIDRLSLIVSDLLTLVSMDARTAKLNRSTFSLGQVIRDNAHRLTPMVEKRMQEMKLDIGDNCDMYADLAKITQVAYNLMENASKYTQEGGTIRVSLKREGRDAIFRVSDNGPGIPKEDQAHIFDRFYRVDKARSRETGGTGLGLSIVHQMVLMHGGSISVESEEGKGSTFIVELPIHQG